MQAQIWNGNRENEKRQTLDYTSPKFYPEMYVALITSNGDLSCIHLCS